jgi:hypothetical protein
MPPGPPDVRKTAAIHAFRGYRRDVRALRETAARLARGSAGRTEADIQADVRGFLLQAPLELSGPDVIAVGLEAQTGDGCRIDVEAGCAAIEVKKNLASKTVYAAAVEQLRGYVAQRTEERGLRFVGILTDGAQWVLFHLDSMNQLSEVGHRDLKGPADALAHASWLETVLATNDRLVPTPSEIDRRLGAGSPAVQLDLAELTALYEACKLVPEVQLKRQLWGRLLLSALGTTFDDSDELFVTHTYLVLTAELLAHQVMGLSIETDDSDVRALIEGQNFEMAGLHGVVEADFFDWPMAAAEGAPIIRAMARRLAKFDWQEVEHDVLKVLYEAVIDTETRKRLGEYYTPDWLAEKMVSEHFTKPLKQRLLDPACGSGTFLFWAVRKALDACDEAGLSNREALEHVVEHVQGVDLHPVAVTLARVTYLLALTPVRLQDRGELTVPVFLGDSVRWEQDETLNTRHGLTIRTSDELELFDQDLHFPEGVLEKPRRFDRLVSALARKAASRRTHPIPKIGGLLNAHHVEDPDDRAAVELVFAKLCRLHDAGRDHVWSYYIRNLARPLSFSRPDGQVDLVVGNPPWLAFRHMTSGLQTRYRALAVERGLWAGGGAATHQDLSDLFVARSIEQYLRPAGSFAMVMPYATLSRFQYEGFRTGSWAAPEVETRVAFDIPESFAKVKPALFPVPCCVVSGRKSREAAPLDRPAIEWSGRVPSHHTSWPDTRPSLTADDTSTQLASHGVGSPYRASFRQGATLVPHVLLKVEPQPAGPLGGTDKVPVRGARSSFEKAPWKSLKAPRGAVEREFIFRTHLGSSIVPFRAREPERAVLPWLDGHVVSGEDEVIDEHPGLAEWWRAAERVWEQHKTPSNPLSLVQRVDYQRGISAQLPAQLERVVYTRSGQYLAACRISDPDVIVEQTLYWSPVASQSEGRYLCAILNSGVVAEAVAPLQSRGQHNPRDFAMSLFALPFPTYDASNDLHRVLSALGEQAEILAAAVDLADVRQFQKARRIVREALSKSGVSAEIDQAIRAVLVSPSERRVKDRDTSSATDLMGALGRAQTKVPDPYPAKRRRPPRAVPPAPKKANDER